LLEFHLLKFLREFFKPAFGLALPPRGKDHRVLPCSVGMVHARHAAKRARQLLGIRTNLSASADAFEIGCDLTRALVLGKKYFYELFVWAAGLPHFREHILLFEDAFVVIFSKLAKELRSVRECREVEITASCLEA